MWCTVNWKLLKGELENCVTALISQNATQRDEKYNRVVKRH